LPVPLLELGVEVVRQVEGDELGLECLTVADEALRGREQTDIRPLRREGERDVRAQRLRRGAMRIRPVVGERV
jgi:hypothetical protein